MAELITELRVMTEAGTADYTLGTVTYFSDDQIQAQLDRVVDFDYFAQLTPITTYRGGGSISTFDYQVPAESGTWIERGTAFVVRDSTGGSVNPALYSVNYDSRVVTFGVDQAGTAYYADVKAYDLNVAAANLWRWKAAHVTNKVDWRSDNHQVSASQERQACFEMAKYYEMQTGLQVGYIDRSDET